MEGKHLTNSSPLRDFVLDQTRQRLEGLAAEAKRAAESHDEEAIHDLRVAMRRFSQSLILFPGFFPGKAAKKITRRLKKMMDRTSEVRNRDIALAHLSGAPNQEAMGRLGRERETLGREFNRAVARWQTKDFAVGWKAMLGLDKP